MMSGAGRPRGRKQTPRVDVDESAVMTILQLAKYMDCHYVTAYRLAQRGQIPGFKVGGRWRFLKSDVDRWIASGGGRRTSR